MLENKNDRRNTIMNNKAIIIFAILGAFLLGFGIDLEIWSLMIPGFIIVIMSLFSAIKF